MATFKNPFKDGFKITSPYGPRTLNGEKQNHTGIDIVGLKTREVRSVIDGTVLVSRIITDKSNATWQWGNYVCVKGTDGKLIYYCHLASRRVAAGQKVKAGDVLGIMGNTGYSFGAHTHFEVREGSKPINAADYLGIPNKTGNYVIPEISQLEEDINVLVQAGIINSPKYWITHGNDVKYLPDLIHSMAESIRKN